MCEWRDHYQEELRSRIDAWEGKTAEDFQYEPDRPLLKEAMKQWLARQMEGADEKAVSMENRKLFAKWMATLVYEENVNPHLADFIK